MKDHNLLDLMTIHDVLADHLVRSVYQPIVRLDSGDICGFEALARGPIGTPFENPEEMFAAARSAQRDGELDALCVTNAVRGAIGTLPTWCPLFVNVEPATLNSELIERTAPIAAAGDRPIMLEVTERAITRSLRTLLAGLASAREHGWQIALDDVGVEAGSLALLPVIRPDVVKLDMGLIRNQPDRELGRTMAAVMAYAERTGATVLAEGIETDEHLERALSLGATLGQGYRFGRPAPLDADVAALPNCHVPLPAWPTERAVALSPYDAIIAAGCVPGVARKNVLLQISHHLEDQAFSDPNAPLLLSAFQAAPNLTRATRVRYAALAEHCALVAALGIGIAPEPVPGVQGAVIHDGDALAGEWSVVVLGPHYCGALVGKDLGDTHCGEPDRRFSYVVTHDRELVELAAESLLRRLHAT